MRIPEAVARAYIEASNRNDQETIASLFSTDALWIPLAPMPSRSGLDEIRRRYLTDVKAANAPITDAVYTSDDNRCVVEFVVQHPEHGEVNIVDVFNISPTGEITRLAVYRR